MPRVLTDLPSDALAHVLARGLLLVHAIAYVMPVSRAFRDAARLAFKTRPCWFGKVETLPCTLHTKVLGVAALPDGRVIVGSHQETKDAFIGFVSVWQADRAVRVLKQAHADEVRVAAVPGGRFVSCSDDFKMKLWRTDGGPGGGLDVDVERTFHVEDWVTSVAALPDGEHLVVGLDCAEIVLYNVDGTLVHTFEAGDCPLTDDEDGSDGGGGTIGHTSMVSALAVTPDGEHIISGAQDHRVKVWSVARKRLVSTFDANSGVNAVAAMPDGQRILSGDDNGGVRLWPLKGVQGRAKFFNLAHIAHTKEKLNVHDEYPAAVWAVVALPDNQHALSGSQDMTVKLINVNDRPSARSILRTFRHHTSPVRCLCLMPDGIRFVSGTDDEGRYVAPNIFYPSNLSGGPRPVACIVETGLAPL